MNFKNVIEKKINNQKLRSEERYYRLFELLEGNGIVGEARKLLKERR